MRFGIISEKRNFTQTRVCTIFHNTVQDARNRAHSPADFLDSPGLAGFHYHGEKRGKKK
jgi:hypothetical protein